MGLRSDMIRLLTSSDVTLTDEATHAINDWHGRSLGAAEDEGLAYVAQMVFVCRRNPAIQQATLTDLTGQRVEQSARMCGRKPSPPRPSASTTGSGGWRSPTTACVRSAGAS